MGTRTVRQVSSRIQKYFLKLERAGLPIPGRTSEAAPPASRVSTRSADISTQTVAITPAAVAEPVVTSPSAVALAAPEKVDPPPEPISKPSAKRQCIAKPAAAAETAAPLPKHAVAVFTAPRVYMDADEDGTCHDADGHRAAPSADRDFPDGRDGDRGRRNGDGGNRNDQNGWHTDDHRDAAAGRQSDDDDLSRVLEEIPTDLRDTDAFRVRR